MKKTAFFIAAFTILGFYALPSVLAVSCSDYPGRCGTYGSLTCNCPSGEVCVNTYCKGCSDYPGRCGTFNGLTCTCSSGKICVNTYCQAHPCSGMSCYCYHENTCWACGSTAGPFGGKCYTCASQDNKVEVACAACQDPPNCQIGGGCVSDGAAARVSGICYQCSNGTPSVAPHSCYCDGCPSGQDCTSSGCVDSCTKKTCAADYSGKCGEQDDGCGGKIDCGSCTGVYTEVMRVRCPGLGEQRIAGSTTEASALKVRRGTTVYNVVLVETTDTTNASCVRVRLPGGTVKALRKM